MTRKRGNSVARAAKATSNKRWVAGDSFQNFEARVGVGTNNQTSGSGYGFDFISRNRIQLEAMYRSSWVVGAVTDVVADDMTRAGIEIESDLAPDKMDRIHAAFERMSIWDRINDTIKWSRLYGGALAVMMIDGQRPETPLNLDGIGPDQFKGLFVLDRWLVQPSLNDLVTEYGPDMGQPKFYDVVADSMALPRQRIHYSRVLRLDGVELPYWQKISENLWGQSVIERLFDRLIAFDSTTAGAAQLVYKAHLRTLAVDDLRGVIAMGGPAMEALLKNVDMIRRFQSNEGITIIDAKDKFETHQYSFSGLDNVLLQFGQQLSGATGIPLVRLFGQSPAGLNSTGDSDIRLYYDSTKQQQERKLRNPLTRLLQVVCRSEIGEAPPEGFQFGFNPLWQMSDTDKANIAKTISDAVTQVEGAGLISQQTALKELRQSSHITGVFSNISDKDINDADDELPDLSELANDPNAGQEAGPKQESGPGAQS